MEIIQAGLDDLSDIIPLRSEFLQIYEGPDYLNHQDTVEKNMAEFLRREMPRDNVRFFFMKDGGNIAGTIAYTIQNIIPNMHCPNGKSAYILNVYVRNEYRGQGLAAKMLDYAVHNAIDAGSTKITLHASEMGEPIYAKYGFKKNNDEMVYYPD